MSENVNRLSRAARLAQWPPTPTRPSFVAAPHFSWPEVIATSFDQGTYFGRPCNHRTTDRWEALAEAEIAERYRECNFGRDELVA